MTEPKPLWRRMLRWLGIVLAVLVLLVLSGLLLADHLTPKAMGAPSHVLPVQPAQTVIDRELARLQADHPDQSGVAFLADGLDAYAARAETLAVSEVRALFSVVSRPEVVSLAGGMPYVAALPQELLAKAYHDLMAKKGNLAIQYGGGQGDLVLRDQIRELMALEGIQSSVEDLVITTGSQHGLDLLSGLFLDKGDVVVAEIDGAFTLKVYTDDSIGPRLDAANPRVRSRRPARELSIRGVGVGLLRLGLRPGG